MNNTYYCSNCENCKHLPICNQAEEYMKLFNEVLDIVKRSNTQVNFNLCCEHFDSKQHSINLK